MSTTFAFQIGYLGDGFAGYARQPGLETVEGTILRGLHERKVIARDAALAAASRTDKGVHALGNVVSFSTSLTGASAARVLNTLHPSILCFGWAEVPRGFQPRHARERWYRYLEPAEGRHLATWKEVCTLFVGVHDFESFSRRDDPPKPSLGELTHCSVQEMDGFLAVDVRAPLFRWNQVRKMVAAMGLVDEGRLTAGKIERALRGEVRIDLPLAPPDRLVLMEVVYPFAFTSSARIKAPQRAFLEDARRGARAKATLLGWFQSRVAAADGSDA